MRFKFTVPLLSQFSVPKSLPSQGISLPSVFCPLLFLIKFEVDVEVESCVELV